MFAFATSLFEDPIFQRPPVRVVPGHQHFPDFVRSKQDEDTSWGWPDLKILRTSGHGPDINTISGIHVPYPTPAFCRDNGDTIEADSLSQIVDKLDYVVHDTVPFSLWFINGFFNLVSQKLYIREIF